MNDGHLVYADAEPVGNKLREGRLVALAVTVRARKDLHVAGRVDANFRGFPKADACAQ